MARSACCPAITLSGQAVASALKIVSATVIGTVIQVRTGAGLVARGRLYDRDVYVRLDAPVFANQSGLAGGTGLGGRGSIARRWTITVGDLW